MPFIIADRVRETSTTVGTGSIALAGAVTGYRTFGSVLASTDTTFYVFADQGGPNWEVGIGTFTSPSTLARTTVLSSSNGGSLVNFTSGTKDVFISLTASRTNVSDQPNVIDTNSSSAALRVTQTGSGNAILVEDSANPDSSPFVVDANGVVGIGETTPSSFASAGMVLRSGTASTPAIFNWNTTNDTSTSSFGFRKDRAGAVVQSGDLLGLLRWQGFDSGSYRTAAQVTGEVDGTPGASDMPGRLVFSTTADGASSPTERMRIDSVGQVEIGSGTVGAPALSVLTDTNTGIYFPAADTIGFVEGGVEAMRIDSSANVGIGTSSPGTRLDVSGSIRASQSMTIGNGGGTYQAGSIYSDGNWGMIFRAAQASPALAMFRWSDASDVERMRMDTSGNVGIGTASPTSPARLHTVAAGNTAATAIFAGTSFAVRTGSFAGIGASIEGVDPTGVTSYQPLLVGGSQVQFTTSGSERARIDTSGNTLINTTTAVSRLTVNGDVSGTFFVNPTTVSANYTIPTNHNAMTAGPITVNSGVVVTVPSGSTWTIL